ncbi:MAG: radical SAM protein [Acidobacteriota bacterium]
MRVTLFTPTPPDISAFGLRNLSSMLKAHGHETRSVFLPGGIDYLDHGGTYRYGYSEPVLDQMVKLSEDADLVGFSFMTQYFDRARQATEVIKKRTKTPVIWGGIHPTARTEEGLDLADAVCRGEGEEAVLELLDRLQQGKDYADIPNIAVKRNGKVIQNEMRELVQNLDTLPLIDFTCENHFVLDPVADRIVPLDAKKLEECLPLMPYFGGKTTRAYRMMTTRGCPHFCSFCAISTLRLEYEGETYLRRQSVGRTMDELEWMLKTYPFIKTIHFFDDTFFAGRMEYFEEFAAAYKKRINVPFYTQASPATLTKPKMDLLMDIGMVFTEMGLQSASEKTKKMYKREMPNEKVIAADAIIDSYRTRLIAPRYHVILDNPWEGKDDLLETLDLILKLKRPYNLCIGSLVLFPATPLHDRAVKEGIIKDEGSQIYRKPFYKPRHTYLNLLICLCDFPLMPLAAIRILRKRALVDALQRESLEPIYRLIFKATNAARLGLKGVQAVTHLDFERIRRFFRRVR